MGKDEIREILQKKIKLIEDEILKISSREYPNHCYDYISKGILVIKLFTNERRSPTENEVYLFKDFGIFAAKELNDDEEPMRTLIYDVGSLATRLIE